MISIEVVYAAKSTESTQVVRHELVFEVAPQVQNVLLRAGFPPAALVSAGLEVSVWGHRRGLDFELQDGDRVELTCALQIDPKLARAHKVSAKPRRGWMARKANVSVTR